MGEARPEDEGKDMRIVEVCPYDMARHGGVQNHIRDLSRWLSRQGHEVRIIAPPPISGGKVEGVEHVGRSRLIRTIGTVTEISYLAGRDRRSLVADLQHWGADVLHLHTPWTPMLAWQIWRAAGVPSVATFHATLPESARRGVSGWAYTRAGNYFLNRLEATVVPSVSPLAHLKAPAGRREPVVLPPAIDLAPWRDAATEGEKPADAARPHIVFLGRLEHRKGVGVLLQAWRKVAEALPGARLTIAGSGPELAMVEAVLRKPWASGIRHVPAPDSEQGRRLVAEADIFVAPAPYGESFGIVLIEAMAAGTVPLAAANEGYRTVLEGPGEALLAPPGDADRLAAKIVDLASAPNLFREMRAWGRARADLFDVARVGPKFLALFEEVSRMR